jgi:hypothetical protein
VVAVAVVVPLPLFRKEPLPERAELSAAATQAEGQLADEADLVAPSLADMCTVAAPNQGEIPLVDLPVVAEEATPEAVEPRMATGGLEGRVLFDGGMIAANLRISIERITPSENDAVSMLPVEWLLDEGTFRFHGLEVGTFRVSVVAPTAFALEPLVPPIEVDVTAGGVTRLADIDVRETLFVHELTVTDEHGAPLAIARGTFSGAGSYHNNDIDGQDGRARIITKHQRINV